MCVRMYVCMRAPARVYVYVNNQRVTKREEHFADRIQSRICLLHKIAHVACLH